VVRFFRLHTFCTGLHTRCTGLHTRCAGLRLRQAAAKVMVLPRAVRLGDPDPENLTVEK
jgi:hypothetical protein